MVNFIGIVALLGVVCFLSRINAEEIHGIIDYDLAKVAEIRQLAPYLVKLNNYLSKEVKKHPEFEKQPDKLIELAKNQLQPGCIGICFTSKEAQRSKNNVTELFVSLENTIGNCDTESYEILASNMIVHQASQIIDQSEVHLTHEVLKYYFEKHAQYCRPIHKRRFFEKSSNIAESDLNKIEFALSTLNISDFGYQGHQHDFDLVGMLMPKISLAPRALRKIVQQLRLQIETSTPEKADGEETSTRRWVHVVGIYNFLDSDLFEPCKNYRKELSTILNEARFDAAVEDGEAQKEYLHEDERFHSALIFNRICGSLLDERPKLYTLMAFLWPWSINTPILDLQSLIHYSNLNNVFKQDRYKKIPKKNSRRNLLDT